ncbi:unnamed protein product [Menidia menidia]|uniref:(Atlantic silverside) hypothetical protein n=1 Tax=Menidia menidia TaxID=238744 RepID=A0A8S4AT59_9TELE|nr:unnamed protein product [Menidia menidia]
MQLKIFLNEVGGACLISPRELTNQRPLCGPASSCSATSPPAMTPIAVTPVAMAPARPLPRLLVVLAAALAMTSLPAAALGPETCFSRQHQGAAVNARAAMSREGVAAETRAAKTEKDCVLACCSMELRPGARCNMAVFNSHKQSGDNCTLFHCPSEQDCPLMKAQEGVNAYNIYKGLSHPLNLKPSTMTVRTSTLPTTGLATTTTQAPPTSTTQAPPTSTTQAPPTTPAVTSPASTVTTTTTTTTYHYDYPSTRYHYYYDYPSTRYHYDYDYPSTGYHYDYDYPSTRYHYDYDYPSSRYHYDYDYPSTSYHHYPPF